MTVTHSDIARFYFNSRPSARGDKAKFEGMRIPGISIHAPPRGATENLDWAYKSIKISIHAPPRGATCIVHREGSGIVFQFTPLREGRHFVVLRR